MTTIQQAYDILTEALRDIEGVRFTKLGDTVKTPGVVLGLPGLTGEGYVPEPTSATFPVFLVVSLGDQTIATLNRLVYPVWQAIEENTDGTISRATPGSYVDGTTELPCYIFDIDYPLGRG